jgi:DNA-binding FrmR family transcriptional regulator
MKEKNENVGHACCQQENSFPDHARELSRLNRAAGQLAGVKRMIEERRYCVDIIQQLRAVRNAVKAVEINILKRHLDSCVSESFADEHERNTKIAEIKDLLAKF